MLHRFLPPTPDVGVQVSFGFVRVVTPATLTRDALHHSLWICRPDGLKIPRAFSPTNSNLLRRGGGFFQSVADISILYKIFGTRVISGRAGDRANALE